MVQNILQPAFLLKQFVMSIFSHQYIYIHIFLGASCKLRKKGALLDGRHGVILGVAQRWAPKWGLPRWCRVKEPACQYRSKRCGFNPWVRKIPWRRAWQPTPVFLPGESRGQRSLVGYSPCCRKESDTTERLHFYLSIFNTVCTTTTRNKDIMDFYQPPKFSHLLFVQFPPPQRQPL